jgi:SpoVK/Ycf46/Vps4 family AAA+-type ATPase
MDAQSLSSLVSECLFSGGLVSVHACRALPCRSESELERSGSDCLVVEASNGWFLQNRISPGTLVAVAAVDAAGKPLGVPERFQRREVLDGDGDTSISVNNHDLGNWCILARVWPSALLKKNDVYLRGWAKGMLGRLDESCGVNLICGDMEHASFSEDKNLMLFQESSREIGENDESGAENQDVEGEKKRDVVVDVVVYLLEPAEIGKAAEDGAVESMNKTPNRIQNHRPGRFSQSPSPSPSSSAKGKFVHMSPSMKKSMGTPPPLLTPPMSNSQSKNVKEKNKARGHGDDGLHGEGKGPGATAASNDGGKLEAKSKQELLVGECLNLGGDRMKCILQSLVYSSLKDTWLLRGNLYPFWFLDVYLGAVVMPREGASESTQSSTNKPCSAIQFNSNTRIHVKFAASRGEKASKSSIAVDRGYTDLAVDAVSHLNDETIRLSVEKAALSGHRSLDSLRTESISLTQNARHLKSWVSHPLQNYEAFKKQGTLPPTGVLLHGPPGTGKTLLARWISREAGAKLFIINGSEVMSDFLGDSERCLSAIFEASKALSPSIVFIDEIDVLGPSRSDSNLSKTASRLVATLAGELDGLEGHPVMVIGATNRKEALDESLRRPGKLEKELEISVPGPSERLEILQALLSPVSLRGVSEQDLEALSLKAHGYVGADLLSVVSEASMIALRRYVRDGGGKDISEPLLSVTLKDLETALYHTKPSALREFSSDVPNISLKDVGGNHELKQRLIEAVQWPIKFKKRLEQMGAVPPKGILLHGPPGCSKTLLVKAIAGECRLNFFSIKGPELLSKFVGESEKALANVFDKARKSSPSILFFDEIDGLVGTRSSSSTSGRVDVGERILSQMLQEMDGIKGKDDRVIIIGATNRMDKLDKALLRPGRFDRILQVDLPSPNDRLEILRIHLRSIPTDDTISMGELVDLTNGFSGAEIAGLCQKAAMHALCEESQTVRGSDFAACLST